MEAALNPAWVQYGAMGLLFFLCGIVGIKVLPEYRRSQEKVADGFTKAMIALEDQHQSEVERTMLSHEKTIQFIVGEQDKRFVVLSEISTETAETSRTLAKMTEVLRQMHREPSARTRVSDSQRRKLSEVREELGLDP